MRGKKTFINTAMSLFEELVAVICGFILPKLILTAFGSQYNGLTTSMAQFLSCAVLLRSGIGGATRAALYKPLAEKNKDEVNAIMKATDLFMRKIGVILGVGIIVFAVIYPSFVSSEFDWFFTFSLFVIIGASTFAESFFGTTYLILLQADQRLWVPSLLRTVCCVLNTVLSAILICLVDSIHIVKLGSSVIFVLYPIVLRAYVKKKYDIDSRVKPDNRAIAQRWDAFWHQIASFIMSNTDLMVLTIFSNMLEVSVYSVYSLVVNGLKKAIFSFSSGLEAAFGNMIARKETASLKENLSLMEWIVYSISTVACTCAIVLVLPFVSVYTAGINDVDYIRPVFAYVMVIALFFNCVRIPYQLVVQAAGHYKQTKNGAIFEAFINIFLSVVLVIRYGLVGVAIGTLAATVFRTIQYSYYICKNIVDRSQWVMVFRLIIAAAEAFVVIIVVDQLQLSQPETYFDWFVNALIVFIVCCGSVGMGSLLFDKDNVRRFGKKMGSIFNKRVKSQQGEQQ